MNVRAAHSPPEPPVIGPQARADQKKGRPQVPKFHNCYSLVSLFLSDFPFPINLPPPFSSAELSILLGPLLPFPFFPSFLPPFESLVLLGSGKDWNVRSVQQPAGEREHLQGQPRVTSAVQGKEEVRLGKEEVSLRVPPSPAPSRQTSLRLSGSGPCCWAAVTLRKHFAGKIGAYFIIYLFIF